MKAFEFKPTGLSRNELLDVHQVAALLGVSERVVRWWAEIGELPGFKIGKKLWRFRKTDIVAYVRQRMILTGLALELEK